MEDGHFAFAVVPLLGGGCETDTLKRERAVNAYDAGDYAAAEKKLNQVMAHHPDEYRSQYWLGRTYLKQDRPLDAQLALERALTLAPRESPMVGNIVEALAEAMYQQGRYDQLHAFLDKTATYYGQTRDYLREADYLLKTGDIDNAKVAYRKAAYFAKNGDATPYVAIAEFYERVGDVPSAVVSLRYGYYVDPTNQEVAAGLRKFGVVPGPTIASEPPKPELAR